ncbi:MAG: DUF4340 domain-containing protein [Proteobacteria bacterium]|nr:DUF4340 domain-containing protein [Pseudomonadota bacterium]
MSPRRLALLLALALAVTGGAFWLSSQRTLPRDPDYGTPVLAGLAGRLDAVDEVRVVGAGAQVLVTLKRIDGRWQVVESGYPADVARVRRLLIALGDLHVVEAKTDVAERYAALGVEDVEGAKAQSVRIELRGLPEPVALLVGHASAGQGAYVRVPGQRQALEARPGIDVARTPRDWLQRTIVDVAPERVQAVEVARSDGPAWRALKKARDSAHFDVPDLPKGRELVSLGAADPAGGALGNLEFDELRRAPEAAPAHPDRAVVRTFDGLVVMLTGHADGEARWLTVAAAFDADAAAHFPPAAGQAAPGAEQVRAEADRITALTHGWEYRVPPYRFDAIFRKRDELLRH